MKNAADMLTEMKAALAEHEAAAAEHQLEAAKLRAMIAAAEGKPGEAASPAVTHGPSCACVICTYLFRVPLPVLPPMKCNKPGICFCPLCSPPAYPFPMPYPPDMMGHGGLCACPQCCPKVVSTETFMQVSSSAWAGAMH